MEKLKKFWPIVLKTAEKYYFQQDGARPHTARTLQIWLKDKFNEKFISCKNMWPPRSPDMNPCDFYLWGHLKSLFYNPMPRKLDDLKVKIEREFQKISKKFPISNIGIG